MRRVCDACSVRRVKCDGQSPCARCDAASLECTRLRTRVKPGPKTIRKTTLERLHTTKRENVRTQESTQSTDEPRAPLTPPTNSFWDVDRSNALVEPTAPPSFDGSPLNISVDTEDTLSWPPSDAQRPQSHVTRYPYTIAVKTLEIYLDIYHHKLYPVWPIVNVSSLMDRLQAVEVESGAYMLASSVCAATILQLQLAVVGNFGVLFEPQAALDEIEDLRQAQKYRQHNSLDSLSTSFFLHIAYLHLGQRTTSTLLLRETISIAHILGLHSSSHYTNLIFGVVQDHLRLWWLLFITERYGRPCLFSQQNGTANQQWYHS